MSVLIEKCEELKPCPFCGAKANLIRGEIGNGCWIECEECMVSTKVDSKDAVIKHWNEMRLADNDRSDLDKDFADFIKRMQDEITREVLSRIEKLIEEKESEVV